MAEKFVLKGVIDEKIDFSEIRLSNSKEIHVYCREISRITSYGIKEWLECFREIRSSGTALKFFEVPPVVFSQVAQVKNVLLFKEIVSICVEYECDKCHTSELKVFTPMELDRLSHKSDPATCPKCKQPMVFSDDTSDYFLSMKEN